MRGSARRPFDSLTRGIQGNFDHLMGVIRNLGKNYNLLVDDVKALSDALENTDLEVDEVAGAAITDHGALSGLADDDHPQYQTPAEHSAVGDSAPHHAAVTVGTGLDVTGQLVTLDLSEVSSGGELGGTMDAPTVDATHSGSTHAATQAAAEATAASALSGHAAAGDPHTGYRLESADHSHQTTGLQAGQLDHGAALTGLTDDDHTQYLKEEASGGTAAEVPDHLHTGGSEAGVISTAGPDADTTIDTAGAAGSAGTEARSGHGHKVSTTDAPSGAADVIDTAATPGATGAIARATHGHRLNTYSSNGAAVGTAAPGTSGTAPSRGDHVHPTGAGTPSSQAFGDAASTGSGPAAAMTDHKHAMPANPTTNIGQGHAFYGDGSDGSCTFSVAGPTTAGATRSGTTYTMQRNIYATSLTVDATIDLKTNGYGIFVTGTLTNNGSIHWNGNAAVTVTGGAAVDSSAASMQPYFGSNAAGASAADAPAAGQKCSSGFGGAGGAGGTNSAGTAGSAGGATPTSQVAGHIPRDPVRAITGYGIAGDDSVFTYTRPLNFGMHMWGGGSGGGAGASVTLGGSGGSGGGHVVIAAKAIVNSGTITATGGAGSAATTASNLGGGGGGGGGGGLVILIYDTFSGTAATAAGGARGNSQGYRSTPVVDGTIDDNTNGATFATGSISPTNGAMYLICVVNRRAGNLPTTPTVAGTNGWNTTWTQVVTGTFAFGGVANSKRMTIFRGVASSGTAGVVTISHGGVNQTSEQAIILRLPLVDTTTNQGVVQAPVTTSGNGTTLTPTGLSAFGSRFNPGVAFYSNDTTVANITPETPWAELQELVTATEQGALAVHYLRYADLSPTATGTSGDWGAWATELATTTTEDSVAGVAGAVVTIANV